jgi:hypothetical protein
MGNNEDDEPNPGVSLPILNVDLDQYSYFDLVDDINRLATDVGYKDAGLLVALFFIMLVVNQKTPLKLI